jgi:hypothetical protein
MTDVPKPCQKCGAVLHHGVFCDQVTDAPKPGPPECTASGLGPCMADGCNVQTGPKPGPPERVTARATDGVLRADGCHVPDFGPVDYVLASVHERQGTDAMRMLSDKDREITGLSVDNARLRADLKAIQLLVGEQATRETALRAKATSVTISELAAWAREWRPGGTWAEVARDYIAVTFGGAAPVAPAATRIPPWPPGPNE